MTSTTSLSSNIKALQTQPTEPQTVKVVSIPFSTDPQVSNLASDEVIVKERAVAINPTDWKHAAGMWGEPHRICGCDGSGDIVAVGSGVNDLSVGDRVAGFTYGTVTKNNGAFAEYTRYKAHAVFKLPDSMSYEEGASYPIPLFTAIQALSFRLNLSPSQDSGKTIFIYSGASAVGYQAIQLSKKYFGLKVITTASPHNHEALKQAGADVTIDYKDQDWIQKVASNGKIDYALDCISENGVTTKVIDTLVKSGTEGAKLITLLPVSEEDSKRSDKVEVEFTLAYCVLGGEVHFAKGAVNFDVKLYDVIQLHHWNRHILPELMGSKKLIGAKLKAMPGGLEGINDAFQYMKDGKVSNEKLVLTI